MPVAQYIARRMGPILFGVLNCSVEGLEMFCPTAKTDYGAAIATDYRIEPFVYYCELYEQ